MVIRKWFCLFISFSLASFDLRTVNTILGGSTSWNTVEDILGDYASRNTVEDILGGSGREETLAEAEVASPGAADAFVTVTHLTIPIILNRSTKRFRK